jgi:hypothetical protein
MVLSKKLFDALSAKHIELSSNGEASCKNSRIMDHPATGGALYDADGAGERHAAVKITSYRRYRARPSGLAA